MNCQAIFIILLIVSIPVHAQELHLLGGAVQNDIDDDISYAWQYDYREGLGKHFLVSISYLNEGHFDVRHRDGYSFQFWTRVNILDRRLSLAAGVGPYYSFDTVMSPDNSNFVDEHGLGFMTSISVIWYAENNRLFQARVNREEVNGVHTVSVLLGVGFQLEPAAEPGPLRQSKGQDHNTTLNEITVLGGMTIVNSFGSEPSTAVSVEYRRELWKYLEWTFAWLDEGDNDMIDRGGVMTELWLARTFFDGSVTFSCGGGVYSALDHVRIQDDGLGNERTLSGVVSWSGSYRFKQHWGCRVSLSRVMTSYNRDTDVLVAGIGYLL